MEKFLNGTGLSNIVSKLTAWATEKFVAKESGKGLSTNDYSNQEKEKLNGLKNPTIEIVKVNNTALTPDENKVINIDLSSYPLKSAVTQEIAQAVSGINGFDAQIVSELPPEGGKGILYLIANNSEENQNAYDEYVWVADNFEKIGTRTIDLSQYALKSEIPAAITNEELDTIWNEVFG